MLIQVVFQYIFDQSRDRYILKSDNVSVSPFLSIEELCHNEKPKVQQTNAIDSEIISNLIKDRFLEVSKYVTLENSSRKITLKLDAARNAGYDIEYV
ncbi:MAG: hypothetical protein ACYDG2_20160 [Ruminiclostridium sp.]